MDESAILYDGWTISTYVQKVCAECLIADGESFNDGPQVSQEHKAINIWNIELVGPSDCEQDHAVLAEVEQALEVLVARGDAEKVVENGVTKYKYVERQN